MVGVNNVERWPVSICPVMGNRRAKPHPELASQPIDKNNFNSSPPQTRCDRVVWFSADRRQAGFLGSYTFVRAFYRPHLLGLTSLSISPLETMEAYH